VGNPGSEYRNPDSPPGDVPLAALAARQHGVVSVDQLRAFGRDKFWVHRKLEKGWLHPLYRGVYAVGHTAVSIKGKYLAAVLACGPGAALSHRAAGHHLGLRPLPAGIDVSVPVKRPGPPGIRTHRSRLLTPADITRVDNIPVTTVARTLLDLAAILMPRELALAIDRAERADVFDLAAIEDLLARANGRKGAAALRKGIAAWRPSHTRSDLEDRHLEFLEAAGFPYPQLNVLVQGERDVHEVDAFWPEQRLVVELDGHAFHRTRRDRDRDADTDADLELAGYRVIRLRRPDVTTHSDRTERRLGRHLHRTRD
jgi:very-short-patch-repair endonuclease